MQIVGLAVSAFTAFVVYFDFKLTEISNNSKEVRNVRLVDGLRELVKEYGSNFEIVRIYALTTEVIYPAFRHEEIKIGNLRIMLFEFSESHSRNYHQLNLGVQGFLMKWRDFVQKTNGKMTASLYRDFPTEYEVILDDKAMLLGTYRVNFDSPHGGDYDQPLCFRNVGVESARFISARIARYDELLAASR